MSGDNTVNEAPQLSIIPPSPPEQPSESAKELRAMDEVLGAGAHIPHPCGPEDAEGKVPVSGRLIIASNLLPWELSYGKGGAWVGSIVFFQFHLQT